MPNEPTGIVASCETRGQETWIHLEGELDHEGCEQAAPVLLQTEGASTVVLDMSGSARHLATIRELVQDKRKRRKTRELMILLLAVIAFEFLYHALSGEGFTPNFWAVCGGFCVALAVAWWRLGRRGQQGEGQ